MPSTASAEPHYILYRRGRLRHKTDRTANVRLTDGASELTFAVRQSGTSSISTLDHGSPSASSEVYDLMGRKLAKPSRGLNIIDGRIVRY